MDTAGYNPAESGGTEISKHSYIHMSIHLSFMFGPSRPKYPLTQTEAMGTTCLTSILNQLTNLKF